MILAIDSSTEWVGLALFDGEQVICEQVWKSHNHHTVELVPAIEQLLNRVGVKKTDLSGLGVDLGPGSFTSLRIGVTVAKGLAMALKLPIIGVHSLDILAAGQPALEMPLWAMLHAGRGLLAFSPYVHDGTEWVRQADAVVITARDLEDRITGSVYVCGEMTPQERQILGRKWKTVKVASPSRCLRRPAVLAELTWKKLQADEVEDPVSITPIYLHTSTPIPG
jgi:tRNA threonylcarbamoyladenosine biosynthesis protein TsaB